MRIFADLPLSDKQLVMYIATILLLAFINLDQKYSFGDQMASILHYTVILFAKIVALSPEQSSNLVPPHLFYPYPPICFHSYICNLSRLTLTYILTKMIRITKSTKNTKKRLNSRPGSPRQGACLLPQGRLLKLFLSCDI